MPYKPHVLIMSWHDLLTRLTNKTHSECHLLQRDMLVSLRGKHQGCLWCKTSRRYHSPPGMHIYVRLFCSFVHWCLRPCLPIASICSFVFLRVYLCVSSPIAKMVINTCAYLLNTSHFLAHSLSPRVQLVVCSSLRCLSTRFCEPRRLVIICLQHLPDFVHLAGDLVGSQFHSHSLSFVFLKLRLSHSCIL